MSLQKNILAFPDGIIEEFGHIADIGLYHIAVFKQSLKQLFGINGRLVVEMLQENIFHLADSCHFLFQGSLVE